MDEQPASPEPSAWAIGESRTYGVDDEMTLPPGGGTFEVSGRIEVGEVGGPFQPILTVDGAQARAVALTDEDADLLADLLIHVHDLDAVIERCDRAVAAADSDDDAGATAYWEAAVIAYGRCFGAGQSAIRKRARHSLKVGDVEALGLNEVHSEMKEHRDRNVGHRGPHDWLGVQVGLFKHPETGATVAIAPFALHRLPDLAAIQRLRALAVVVRASVRGRVVKQQETLALAHQMPINRTGSTGE